MTIDTHHIANLARISLTEDEHVSFSKDIESILSFIDTIQAFPISTEAKGQSVGMAPIGVTRLDAEITRAGEKTPTEIVLQARASQDNYVKVKKILN